MLCIRFLINDDFEFERDGAAIADRRRGGWARCQQTLSVKHLCHETFTCGMLALEFFYRWRTLVSAVMNLRVP